MGDSCSYSHKSEYFAANWLAVVKEYGELTDIPINTKDAQKISLPCKNRFWGDPKHSNMKRGKRCRVSHSKYNLKRGCEAIFEQGHSEYTLEALVFKLKQEPVQTLALRPALKRGRENGEREDEVPSKKRTRSNFAPGTPE